MTFDWTICLKYFPLLLSAAKLTVLLLITSTLIGTLIGLIFVYLNRLSLPLMSSFIRAYTWIFRSFPPLLLLFIFYFGLGEIGLKLNPFSSASIAFSLIAGAYYTEIIRSGIEAIEKGQIEAGKSLGMSNRRIIIKIVIPQAIPMIIPPFLSNVIANLKDTGLACAIAVPELMGIARSLSGSTMHPIEIFTAVAIIFVILSSILAQFQSMAEKRFAINK